MNIANPGLKDEDRGRKDEYRQPGPDPQAGNPIFKKGAQR